MKGFKQILLVLCLLFFSPKSFSCDYFARFKPIEGEEGLRHAITHVVEPLIFNGSLHHSWDKAKLVRAIRRNDKRNKRVWDLTLKNSDNQKEMVFTLDLWGKLLAMSQE